MSTSSRKPISTFGRRKNRPLRKTKAQLMEELLPKVELKLDALPPLTAAEYWLEIGFGGGEHLAVQAAAHPHVQFIGCEPFVNGQSALLLAMRDQNLQNIRIFGDDARLLMDALPDALFSRVFILFPDPWPKNRHHKRRLIQQEFLRDLARVMKPGAALVLATDHVDYLTWMLEHMLASPHFQWTARSKADWETPPKGWVKTGYQAWAETEGRIATYLNFTRR